MAETGHYRLYGGDLLHEEPQSPDEFAVNVYVLSATGLYGRPKWMGSAVPVRPPRGDGVRHAESARPTHSNHGPLSVARARRAWRDRGDHHRMVLGPLDLQG